MILLPPRSTRTDTLFPYTTLFRSGRLPHAAAGNGNCDPPVVARVQRYGMDARLVIAAAEPLRTARLVPQCAVQRPALAAVLAAEQPAGDGACPQHSRLAGSAGLQRPEQVQAWRIQIGRDHV